jgi:predicted enzyme related to lactoylglutathione lyase
LTPDDSPSVFRAASVSYLRIPAPDPQVAAAFYAAVFGWEVRTDRDDPGFSDGSGHVIGHFSRDHEVAGPAGIRPYVYVDDVAATIERVEAHGGALVDAPYAEGDLTVATFRDPAGNVVGIWQQT